MRAKPITFERAKALRRPLTDPLRILWSRLKSRKLDGLHVRVQHPIGVYILDFYCSRATLCVEVDGAMHGTDAAWAHDRRRDAWLESQSIETLRFQAREVRENLTGVLLRIAVTAAERKPPQSSGSAG
jgi:very-short-patch-repair endonuclease